MSPLKVLPSSMSTTTETRRPVRLSILKPVALCGAALLSWFVGLAAITAAAASSGTVMALIPAGSESAVLESADASIVATAGPFLHLRSDRGGLVRSLYQSGAWLVLPVPRKGGCMVLSS